MNEKAKSRLEAKNILGYPRFNDLPYVADTDGLVVCHMSGGNCDTVEARAVLFAAAPELLEALKNLTNRYVALVESGDCGFWNPEEDKEIIESRAAIADAKEEGS